MSGLFLYYVPGLQVGTVTPDKLREAGLEMALRDGLESQAAFDERLIVNQVHANGPDKSSGVIVTVQPPRGLEILQKTSMQLDEQDWQPAGKYWIGVDKRHRPTPAMLERPVLTPGIEERLGDGQIWKCPIIRRLQAFPNLPRAMGLDEAGEFCMRTLPAWNWAWEMSGEIFEWAMGQKALNAPDFYRLAVACLSVNYRIGPREASLLGLVTTDNFERIFDAALDFEKVNELYGGNDAAGKKKEDSSRAGACEYLAWFAGRLSDYAPSRGDLYLLSNGVGRDDPVAIVGVPVRR